MCLLCKVISNDMNPEGRREKRGEREGRERERDRIRDIAYHKSNNILRYHTPSELSR